MKRTVNVFWFRRDLRLTDNAGLYHALRSNNPVLPIFIFDRNVLDQLEDKNDRRVEFIHQAIEELSRELSVAGTSLKVFHGFPDGVFEDLLKKYSIEKVFTNSDYEPYAIKRDALVNDLLKKAGAVLHAYKDQVIFEKKEVIKDDGSSYTVFTPYAKRWIAALADFHTKAYPVEKYFANFISTSHMNSVPSLQDIGFCHTGYFFPSKIPDPLIIARYREKRDFPGEQATSRLGVHLRFGTISIRQLLRSALSSSEVYLNELIWREFYQMILWNFPHVGRGQSFRKEYEMIPWRNNEHEFELWCDGMTGYPIVDAGMRELNATGFMHNRVRMIVASFLCKHLLIDWRWGEAYFARKLLDYEMASNNGGWQWAAGSGCDAVPYFRIFNPSLQTKKFDPDFVYIRKWVPEFEDFGYPARIVDHEFARKRCLEVYSKALKR